MSIDKPKFKPSALDAKSPRGPSVPLFVSLALHPWLENWEQVDGALVSAEIFRACSRRKRLLADHSLKSTFVPQPN